MKWRINLVFFLILLFSAAILGKLFFIQVREGDLYKALAQGFYISSSEIQKDRGKIFFKNQEFLAVNWSWPLVFASPIKIKDPQKTAEILSPILNLSESFILGKIEGNDLYALIKNRLTKEEVDFLNSEDLDGIFIGQERGRYYPQETLASQLVGFLGAGGYGQYGVEEYYDEILQAGDSDLTLTIDYNIQFLAEKLLERAKENLAIEEGQIIIMDPNSGSILTMANFPNFNPNQYKEYADQGNLEIFQNGITQKIFEPGSTFKPITMAFAINEGKITPETSYRDSGMIRVGGWPIYNYERRIYPGNITMTEVLEKSINTGAVFAQSQINNEIFKKYIEKFGFFEKTGIDLSEVSPENREFKQSRDINFATASFGQGIEMTPLQLARAFSAIANGGKLITPYLVEEKNKLEEFPVVISSKTASQLTAMLVSVIESGFAKAARIPGYYIAGKTGTAQVAFSALGINKPGYSEKTIQSFVGFAPAFNPQFLILVKLNNPRAKTAEYSAMPIFRELAEYIIHHYQIPPDYNL